MVMTHPSGIFPKYQMRNHGLIDLEKKTMYTKSDKFKEFAEKQYQFVF